MKVAGVTAILAVVAALNRPAAAQPAGSGERAFQKCYACHSVDPTETNLPGPNLSGLIGRRAGTAPAFEYSAAMQAAGAKGLVWDRASLDRFLVDPEAVVPGTSMARPHLEPAAERRAVIDYLAKGR